MSSFIEDITKSIPYYDDSSKLTSKINDQYSHAVIEYIDSKNYYDLYVSYFKWAYLTRDYNIYMNSKYNLVPIRSMISLSKDKKDDVDAWLKKSIRKMFPKDAALLQVKHIAQFFEALYKFANERGYTFGSTQWKYFWEAFETEDLMSISIPLGIDLSCSFEELCKKDDGEKEDPDINIQGEYIFDELSESYLNLTKTIIPEIMNVNELNSAIWFLPGEERQLKTDIVGLIDTVYNLEKDKFYERKWGDDKTLDRHFLYNMTSELLIVSGFEDLCDHILDVARNVLTADEKDQKKSVEKNDICFISPKDKNLLTIFFNAITQATFFINLSFNKEENNRCTYRSAFEFLKYIRNPKSRKIINDSISKILKNNMIEWKEARDS